MSEQPATGDQQPGSNASAPRPLRVVLYEGSGSSPLDPERRTGILKGLLKSGFAVTCSGGEGAVAPVDDSDLLVLGEFDGAGPPHVEDAEGKVSVRFRNLAGADVDGVLGIVEAAREETQSYKPGNWKPWFPVIDYERCTNCMQCLSFCLFDVYGVDQAKEIKVQSPDHCKTNCPACSRVCPEVAILFPKYRGGPINGDVVNPEDIEREKMKIDVSALLGGDIYSMLRDRHARATSRFTKERDEAKALKERMKCLKKLGDQIDIPPEVMMALPGLEEIERKAKEAAEKGQRALKEREEIGA